MKMRISLNSLVEKFNMFTQGSMRNLSMHSTFQVQALRLITIDCKKHCLFPANHWHIDLIYKQKLGYLTLVAYQCGRRVVAWEAQMLLPNTI